VIAGRAMQGLGLALLPLAMAAARDHLPRGEATRAIAALAVIPFPRPAYRRACAG